MGQPHGIGFKEAAWVWARIACLSFGGPAGQIAVMHRILVEEKKWIGEARFLHALNFCMLLPGPEAQQLATYVGWLLHGVRGGLIAGVLFVVPGVLAIMALSWAYWLYGAMAPVEAVFLGLKAAVLAIVLEAVRRIGARTLRTPAAVALAAMAFAGIFFLSIPFPLIVLGAGLFGLAVGRWGWAALANGGHGGGLAQGEGDSALGSQLPPHARPSLQRAVRLGVTLLVLWLGPVLLLLALLGPDNVFTRIGLFFSQMAVVTFGGAYAVLAYVAQAAVETYGWLKPGEMLDGLGLAETTPGPLIMVTQFVGFMGAARLAGDSMHPLLAGTLGGLLTTWVTFVPCFLWIFLGAPYAERLRDNRALAAALAAITAAVVGVILNLAIWFGLHTVFGRVDELQAGPLQLPVPDLSTLNTWAAGLSVVAILAAFRFRLGPLPLIGGGAAAGLLGYLLGVPS